MRDVPESSWPDDEPDGPESPGHVGPTGAGLLIGVGLAALVGGWLLRPVSGYLGGSAPLVGWTQISLLAVAAAVLAFTAWATWRQVQVRRERLAPHRAVNRLVLAKSCAIAGAVVAGGYAGYALSWIGVAAELADQRMLRSAFGALAGVAIAISSLALERACRVSNGDPRN